MSEILEDIVVDVSKMETTTPTCEKSSQVGNAAAMREALVMVKRLFDGRLMWQTDIRKAHEAVNAALAHPPRNCDRYTLSEALRKFGFPTKSKPWGEKEWLVFCEWYISEAKGEAK